MAGRGCRIVALGIHRATSGPKRSRASDSSGSAVVARGTSARRLGPESSADYRCCGHRMVVEVPCTTDLNHFRLRLLARAQRRLSSSLTALKFAESRFTDSLCDRPRSHRFPVFRTDVREPQKIERLRLALASPLSSSAAKRPNSIRRVLSGCSSNPNFRSVPSILEGSARHRLVARPHDDIIRVPHDYDVASSAVLSPVLGQRSKA